MLRDNLIFAIQNKRVIKLSYKNMPYRIGWPHALYIGKEGMEKLDLYQISGFSESGKDLPAWSSLRMNTITSIEVLDNEFTRAPGYNPRNTSWYVKMIACI